MFTRRRFLQGTGLAGGFAIGSGLHGILSSCARQTDGMDAASGNPVVRAATRSFTPDLEIDLQATPTSVLLKPGQATQVWSYKTKLIKGDAGSLETFSNRYLGPILRVRQGQRVRVNFHNSLPAGQPTVVIALAKGRFKSG
jgi:FtsP/CotA-like multicopper oxidase with cupredoxin domain